MNHKTSLGEWFLIIIGVIGFIHVLLTGKLGLF